MAPILAPDRTRSSRQIDRMSTTISHPPPNVRLQLRNQPENISLIRTTLAGVAQAIDLPHETLDDVRTAVTEAANNVVLHAYHGDHDGSLEVDIKIAPSAIAVVVRDEGVGIPTQAQPHDASTLEPGEIDAGSLKLGLPVIAALASRVELHKRPAGGTEVRMEFATGPAPPLDPSPRDGPEIPRVELSTAEHPTELITATTITITPNRLARTVLPRLLCALAARADFCTDRLSDAQLLADAIAAQASQSILGSHLHVGIAIEPRQVELRVGPLPAVRGHGTAVDAVLGELAPIIQRLADDYSLTPVGPASVLALQLSDRR